jgi:mannosyltransferase
MNVSRNESSGHGLTRGRARLIAAAIVLLALALRLHTLAARPLWDDEAWTLMYVYLDNPWRIITVGLTRFNPPLLVVSNHLISWVGAHLLGTTPSELRVVPVLFGTLGVGVIYAVGALLFAPESGLIAAAFAAVNVLQIIQSQELRTYPLFLLLAWSSIGLLVRALRDGRRAEWALYGAATLLLIYAHDYAVFVLAAQALYLIVGLPVRRAAPLLVRLAAFWAAAYAPAAVLFARAEHAGRSMELGVHQEANLRTLESTYEHLTVWSGASTFFTVCVLAIILLGAGRLWAQRQLRGAFAMVSFLAAVPFLAWCVSPPIPFGPDKYYIFAAPALLLLLAQGLLEIRPPALRLLVIGGLLASSLPALAYYYDHNPNAPYDRAAEYVKSADPGLPMIFVGNGLRVFNYYYIGEFPRLGSPGWNSLVARVPRRDISFDRTAKDPFRPPPCDNMYCERIAPGLFWTGRSIADTVRKLDPSIAKSFWLVFDRREPGSAQELQDPRCRLVSEQQFEQLHVRHYAFVQ